MENSQGNWVNPPKSVTIAGTAAARIVESMATRAVESITAARIGPRSLRRPTPARVTSVVTTWDNHRDRCAIPWRPVVVPVSPSREGQGGQVEVGSGEAVRAHERDISSGLTVDCELGSDCSKGGRHLEP